MKKLRGLFIIALLSAIVIPYFMGYRYRIEKKEEPVFAEADKSVSSPTITNLLMIIENEGEILSMIVFRPTSNTVNYIDGGLFAYISASYENSDEPEAAASAALLAKTGISAKFISLPLFLVKKLVEKTNGVRPYFEKEITVGSKKLSGEVYIDKESFGAILLNSEEMREVISPLFSAFVKSVKKNIGFSDFFSITSLVYKEAKTNLSFANAAALAKRIGKMNTDKITKLTS